MLPLNFRIVFCTRSPESFAAAREGTLKISGNPSRTMTDLFIREQELMRELIANRWIPSLTLEFLITIPTAVERVDDWLESSGGLYMPD